MCITTKLKNFAKKALGKFWYWNYEKTKKFSMHWTKKLSYTKCIRWCHLRKLENLEIIAIYGNGWVRRISRGETITRERLRLRSHYSDFILIRFCSQKRSCFLLCSHYSVFRQKRISINWCSHYFSKTHLFFSLSENKAFKASDIGVFKLLRYLCLHYRVAFLFSSVFI